MLFSFDKLIINCIHNDLLTNRLRENRLRKFFSSLIRVLARHSGHTWKQIKAKDPHLHILSDKEKDFLEKQLKKHYSRRKLAEYLNNFQICQMSLDEEEGRVIGVIRQVNSSTKHPERNYLFWPLFFDFEHSFHPNLRKKKLKTSSLICIMEEEDCVYH